MCHRRSLKFAHSLSHLLLLKSFHQSPQQAIRLIGHGTTSSPLLVSSSHPISLSNLVHATRSTATRLVSLLLPALKSPPRESTHSSLLGQHRAIYTAFCHPSSMTVEQGGRSCLVTVATSNQHQDPSSHRQSRAECRAPLMQLHERCSEPVACNHLSGGLKYDVHSILTSPQSGTCTSC